MKITSDIQAYYMYSVVNVNLFLI